MKYLTVVFTVFICCFAQAQNNCNYPPEAERHISRSGAALELAKNRGDFLDVIKELESALKYVPNCADIIYNIALIYDKIINPIEDNIYEFNLCIGYCEKAIEYLKRYLPLSINEADRKDASDWMYRIEFLKDKITKDKEVLEPEMVFVQGGTFIMGCTDRRKDCNKNELPSHPGPSKAVMPTVPIHVKRGVYEVTSRSWGFPHEVPGSQKGILGFRLAMSQ